MKARCALIGLMRDSEECRNFFKRCTETSPLRLRSQAWQWRAELHARGQDVTLEDVEDALCNLTGELLTDSPGAAWDGEYAAKLLPAVRDPHSQLPERYYVEARDLQHVLF